MIALVPWAIALATSVVSARVGLGWIIIESSIWVAVITTLPASYTFSMMRCWMIGTCSSGNFHPHVASGDHDAVRLLDDRINVVNTLLILDLSNDIDGLSAIII